ncbi:MAG: HNH endonuclease [Methanosarcinales archaeon]|nr:HNH endonuclease [Methanosarcinales archaeon]
MIEMEHRRRNIPTTTKQIILMEAGYKCANPICRHILTLELHHIIWVKDGGGSDPENLIALCPNCHSLHTNGSIPTKAIEVWKSLLVSLNNPNRATVDLLLVLYREEERLAAVEADSTTASPPFRFTGDGLGVLAGLISAGLVEISKRYSGASYFGGGMPSFEVRLTESGQRLVNAWLSGSPEAIEDALQRQSNQAT